MKKKYVAINIIFVMLVAVFLSGCATTTYQSDKRGIYNGIQVVSYTVSTYGFDYNWASQDGNYLSLFSEQKKGKYLGSGFIHFSQEISNCYSNGWSQSAGGNCLSDNITAQMKYTINGTLKNIAGKMIKTINMTISYLDKSNNVVHTEKLSIVCSPPLANSYTKEFVIEYFGAANYNYWQTRYSGLLQQDPYWDKVMGFSIAIEPS